ncbi:MAG: ATP-binding protein, partial [Pirellulaceae bacterium]|nr:ATP-binding protein [Pirellulaceae bacterium]
RFVSEVDPQHVDFHINDTVRDVAQLIDFDVAAHHVRLEFDFDEGLPAVHGEQISLEQVLVNLMRNGFHAMKNVPTADRLMTVSTARDGNFIQVAVRDSGVGFQGKSLDELIQPFVTNKIDGVGLGLAICRNTIQLAGGRFWAQENDQPPGVTFLFTYPVSPRVDSSLGEATST